MMKQLFGIVAMIAAIAAAPALAEPADPHAGHHPGATAKVPAKPAPAPGKAHAQQENCPMMKDHMGAGQGMMMGKGAADHGGMSGEKPAAGDGMKSGGMMKKGMMGGCKTGEAKGVAEEQHSHEH